MNEATRKAQLVKQIKATFPGFVVFRHEDSFTAGIPDISVSNRDVLKTVWLEVKYGNEPLTALQEQTLRKLNGFVVRYPRGEGPTLVHSGRNLNLVEAAGAGHFPVLKILKERLL